MKYEYWNVDSREPWYEGRKSPGTSWELMRIIECKMHRLIGYIPYTISVYRREVQDD